MIKLYRYFSDKIQGRFRVPAERRKKMAKKRTGLLIAFGAALGAAAAGISYYLKYKSFNDELDKDFHDYEDDESTEEKRNDAVPCSEAAGRTYIPLDPGKHKACEEEKTEEPAAAADAPAPEAPERTPSAATVEEDTEGEGE